MFLEKTEIHDIDPNAPDEKILHRASEVILGGGIVVYPTDTLYGFGVDARNLVAMNRLYELKGRDDKKPVSLIIKNLNSAEAIVGKLDDYERKHFNKLFPGKIKSLQYPGLVEGRPGRALPHQRCARHGDLYGGPLFGVGAKHRITLS